MQARDDGDQRAIPPRIWGSASCIAREKPPLLFTENETNNERLFGTANATPYVKDGINNYLVHGQSRGGEPGEDRDQSRRPLSAKHGGRRSDGDSAAAQTLRLGPASQADPFGTF